jgi:aminoglycoside phosphotransferase (APT) family kinase protein
VTAPPPGLDPAALTAWWRRTLDEGDTALADGTALTAELIAGGKSNLTYRVTDGARTWVVRRPPLGHVLATAHDMAREHRVMSALAETDVPVPRTHALCEDDAVLGATFYVMEDVAGTPYRTAAELEPLGADRVRRISEGMVDTLATLHQVDPDEVGLADFGRPDGFLGRQVRRWGKQMAASRSRDLPAAEELHARLTARVDQVDTGATTGIVHGDYRLDNILTDGRDRPAAVVDWEMATLGDTLTDVALLVVYDRLATLIPGVVADATAAPGFLSEEEMLERYAAARGGAADRGLADLGFHVGLATYKLAAILEGIHYRHQHGQTVGEGFDRVGDAVHPLLDAGLAATAPGAR